MFQFLLIIKIGKASVTKNRNINQSPNYYLHFSSSPSCQTGRSHPFSSPCSCSSSFPCSCFFSSPCSYFSFSPCFGSFSSLYFCFFSAFDPCFDFSLFSPCSCFFFSPSPLFCLDPSSQALFSFPSSPFR